MSLWKKLGTRIRGFMLLARESSCFYGGITTSSCCSINGKTNSHKSNDIFLLSCGMNVSAAEDGS